jgi:hypothetical protein
MSFFGLYPITGEKSQQPSYHRVVIEIDNSENEQQLLKNSLNDAKAVFTALRLFIWFR